MHEEFVNLIPAPEEPEIHMDPISIDHDEYESSSDDMEFQKASLLAPIVDDTRIGRSGRTPRTPSDPRIASDVASDVASDPSSDGEDADDVDSAQCMDIHAPHTTIPSTPRERETDPAIDDPTTSSSAIIADPAEVLVPRSNINQPTPAPVRFPARLAEKRGRTTRTIYDSQPSVHTIYAVDPVDANPDPVNIEDALSRLLAMNN
jgi:hypothetical protein